jgi:hypothetical protein
VANRPYSLLNSSAGVSRRSIFVRSSSASARICRWTDSAIRERSGIVTGCNPACADGGLSVTAAGAEVEVVCSGDLQEGVVQARSVAQTVAIIAERRGDCEAHLSLTLSAAFSQRRASIDR